MLHVVAQSALCTVDPYDTAIDFVPAEMYRARRAKPLVVADGIVIDSETDCGVADPPPVKPLCTGGSAELLPPPPPPQAASAAAAMT
jgi:hypothetical protein